MTINLNNYQTWTNTTAIYPKQKELEYLGLGLASEAGEVCSVIKKHIRDNTPLNDLFAELGDCIWYLARISDCVGWSLEDIIQANREKLESRKERNVISGSGNIR